MNKALLSLLAVLAFGALPLQSAVITVGLDDAVSVYSFVPVRYTDPLFSYEPGEHSWDTYMSFDLEAAGISSSDFITSAVLRLYTNATEGAIFLNAFGGIEASGDYEFHLADAAGPWNSSSITWANKPGNGSQYSGLSEVTYTQLAPFPDPQYQEYWVEIDLTSLANYWAANPLTNYGLRLYIDEGIASFVGNTGNAFAPQLVITTVPEPGSASLLLLGGVGLSLVNRLAKRSSLRREI